MTRERFRSIPPRRGRDYSRDNRQNGRYSHGSRGGNRGRDRCLVENENLGLRDTTSMKFQWNHLLDFSERVNVDAKLGSEYPSGLTERTEYRRRMDEDRDRQSWKRSNLEEDLSWKHGLGESDWITSNERRGPRNVLEYGGGSGIVKGSDGRKYPDSRFEEVGSSRMMVEKMINPETDLTFRTYYTQSGNKRSYPEVCGGGSYSPLKKFSGGIYTNAELRLHEDSSREIIYGDRPKSNRREEIPRFYSKDDRTQLYSREEENLRLHPREEKPRMYSREEKPYLYYNERDSQFSLEDSLHHKIPSSQHKTSAADAFGSSVNDFRSSYKDSRPVDSDGYNRSSEYLTKSFPTENTKLFMEDVTNYKKDKLSPNLGSHIDYGYSRARNSDHTEMVPLPDKPYGTLSFAKDDYRHIDPLESRVMDPIVDVYTSLGEHLTGERLRDNRRSPLERLASNYLDAPRSSYAIGSNVEGVGRRDMDLGYTSESYRSHENTISREDHGYARDKGLNSYLRENYGYGRDASPRKERANSYKSKDYDHIYARADQIFDGDYYDRLEKVKTEDVGVLTPRKDVSKWRRDIRERLSIKRNFSGRAGQIFNGDYYDPLERVKAEDVGTLTQRKDVSKRRRDIHERLSINRNFSSKARDNSQNKSLLRGPRYRNPWVSNDIVRPGKRNAIASRSNPVGEARAALKRARDIKKRLGPARPVEHIALRKQMNQKLSRTSEDGDGDGDGSVQAEDEGPSEHDVEAVKSEPPEKSEEFKQLVRSAFFKFFKQLNENMVELGKFKEQGKTGSLKCWVCGSGSKEFPDTETLVKHACSTTRVGFKAQHLGFHKTLCALMGWKAAEIHKDEWVLEVLSVAEIASLKEDLILWPPLVVVHNSSIRKRNPDGAVVVTVEDLQTMIRDMGFGEKTKVCRGKHVNQSIMLVKFSATYSGFQEAERLHKFFANHKHGRTEFLKSQSTPIGSNDKQKASTNNMQEVLYGFLAIGSDLNKLDSESKKRCVVRSKKEIQDLGDAPLEA